MKSIIFLLMAVGAYSAKLSARAPEDQPPTSTPSTSVTSKTSSLTSTKPTSTSTSTSKPSTTSPTSSTDTASSTRRSSSTNTHSEPSETTSGFTRTITTTNAGTTATITTTGATTVPLSSVTSTSSHGATATATAEAVCEPAAFSRNDIINGTVTTGGLYYCEGQLKATDQTTLELPVAGDQRFPMLLCYSSDRNSQVQIWAVASGQDDMDGPIEFKGEMAREAVTHIREACCNDDDECGGYYILEDKPVTIIAASI